MDLVVLCASSEGLVAKDILTIAIAAAVFIGNAILQYFIKRSNVRDRISGEVVSICDKMIRYAVEAENSVLMMKYWNKVLLFYPLSEEANKENNKNAITESTYYHRKLEDAGIKLDLLKSELKKHTSDLRNYWSHELQARIILQLMSEAVLKDPRRFDDKLIGPYSSIEEVRKECFDTIDNVIHELVFDGMGYDLIKIQKIIDPKSPTLLLSHEKEEELMQKILREDRYY